jgi:glycosyltransferase involved in cell wall biosynthesis
MQSQQIQMRSGNSYVLSTYPLSKEFRTRLEDDIQVSPLYLSIADLRQRSAWRVLNTLLSLGADTLFLAMEDESGSGALPILQILAFVTRAHSVQLINPQVTRSSVSNRQILKSFSGFAWASIRNYAVMLRAKREVARLLQSFRKSAKPAGGRSVVFINANLWFGLKAGGAVGHIAGITNALDQSGYPVTYCACSENAMIASAVRRFRLESPTSLGFPQDYNHYYFHFRAERQILKSSLAQDCAFVYQRMSVANYVGISLSRAWGVPFILEYNGSEARIAKNWRRRWANQELAESVEKACLRHAHLVVTVSEVLAEELLQTGVEPERIVCYPNCVDPALFDPSRFTEGDITLLRKKLGIPSDAVVFTFLGTFFKWHGAEVLARAIRTLVVTENDWLKKNKVRFLLVGDGIQMPFVKELLSDSTCQSLCTLTGTVEQAEAPKYLAASDVLLSPHVPSDDGSRFFGSPTKLFEYMAMGKAIIASELDQIGTVFQNSLRVNSLPEDMPIGGEDRIAILVQPANITQLVIAMKFLAERPLWREKLGSNARTEALSKYTWTHHVNRILDRARDLEII